MDKAPSLEEIHSGRSGFVQDGEAFEDVFGFAYYAAGPDDHEDITTLDVREQAAIALSIVASDRVFGTNGAGIAQAVDAITDTPVGYRAEAHSLAWQAFLRAPGRDDGAEDQAMERADAEAMIRTGWVR